MFVVYIQPFCLQSTEITVPSESSCLFFFKHCNHSSMPSREQRDISIIYSQHLNYLQL